MQPLTFWQIVFSGGPLGIANMVALILLSIAAVALVIDNFRFVSKSRLIPEGLSEEVRKLVAERILGNELFCLAARPKALSPLLLSRYEPGMAYGSHVDDALMGGMRSDVSFTLFLSDAASYDGGELIIESAGGEEAFRLDAGSLIAYPATSLHRVGAVTRGARLAAVGWARSFVRDPAQRELLFYLDTARRQLFTREGKSTEFDLISKSFANLLRMWADD